MIPKNRFVFDEGPGFRTVIRVNCDGVSLLRLSLDSRGNVISVDHGPTRDTVQQANIALVKILHEQDREKAGWGYGS